MDVVDGAGPPHHEVRVAVGFGVVVGGDCPQAVENHKVPVQLLRVPGGFHGQWTGHDATLVTVCMG